MVLKTVLYPDLKLYAYLKRYLKCTLNKWLFSRYRNTIRKKKGTYDLLT